MYFKGFKRGTFLFLEELEQNNTREWFDRMRPRYETFVKAPSRDLVKGLAPGFAAYCPEVHAVPTVAKGSIFRFNRDTRFSKDKTPYKTHLDFFFWIGEGRSRDCAGFFLRFTKDRVFLGAGKHGFDPKQLGRYREAVASRGDELRALVDPLIADGCGFGEQTYKRVPRGYPSDHPHADLLRHGSLYVDLVGPHPEVIDHPELLEWLHGRFAPFTPVLRWLAGAIGP